MSDAGDAMFILAKDVERWRVHYPDQRLGQAWMNCLYMARPDLHERVRVGADRELDPFYVDDRLPEFLAFLRQEFAATSHSAPEMQADPDPLAIVEQRRVELCKALAIRSDRTWEMALEDARNAGIVRDAEYRAHDRIEDENVRLREAIANSNSNVNRLLGQVAAVRRLHERRVLSSGFAYCSSCMKPDNAEEYEPWPCPTVAALDAPEGEGGPADAPENGHTFAFSVTCRGSSSVAGQPGHDDANWWGDPMRLSVRAWSLRAACAAAAEVPLSEWSWTAREEDVEATDPPQDEEQQ